MISGEWGKGDSLLSDSLAAPLPPLPQRDPGATADATFASLAFQPPRNPYDSDDSTLQQAPAEYNRLRHRVVLTVQRLKGHAQRYEGMTAEVHAAEETLIELDNMMQSIEIQVREELAGLSGCQEVWMLRLAEWRRDTTALRSELRTLHAGIEAGSGSSGIQVSGSLGRSPAVGVRVSISSQALGSSRRTLLDDEPVAEPSPVGDRLLMGLTLFIFCVAAIAAPMLRSVMVAIGSATLMLVVCMMQRRRQQRARLMDASRNGSMRI